MFPSVSIFTLMVNVVVNIPKRTHFIVLCLSHFTPNTHACLNYSNKANLLAFDSHITQAGRFAFHSLTTPNAISEVTAFTKDNSQFHGPR